MAAGEDVDRLHVGRLHRRGEGRGIERFGDGPDAARGVEVEMDLAERHGAPKGDAIGPLCWLTHVTAHLRANDPPNRRAKGSRPLSRFERRAGRSKANKRRVPHTWRVIPILAGLGTALFWAASTLTSSRAGRLIGATSTCAWMMCVGVLVAAPLAFVTGPVPALQPSILPWLAGSAIGGVVGILLTYRGLRLGKAGVVASLASTEGAIAAIFAVMAGEKLTLPVAVVLVMLAGGVAVVALAAGDAEPHEQGPEQVGANARPRSSARWPRSPSASRSSAPLSWARASICRSRPSCRSGSPE